MDLPQRSWRFGSGSRAEIRLFGFSPEGETSLPVCVSHRIWKSITSKGPLFDMSLLLPPPKRSILGGLMKFLAAGCGFNEIAPVANSSAA